MPTPARPERDLDLVLFGATGFTGGLTAEYVAAHTPAGTRWGLAGRDRTRLEAVRARLAAPAADEIEILPVDITDSSSLAAVVSRARVVITTIGPYLELGEPLVKACAEAGTDYADLTGEPEFVDRMYVRYHRTAVETGARIVHACGFDSIPADLGALFAVTHLNASGPVTLRGVVRAKGMVSGGTVHSALNQFSRVRQMRQAAAQRGREQTRLEGRRSRAITARPGKDPILGCWLVPLPTIDAQIVARSGAELTAYGSDFTYSHFAGASTLPVAAGAVAGAAAIALAAQVAPARRWLGARFPQGQGPDEQRRASSWFRLDLIGEGDGRRVHARVSGGDPGYGETSKMLAESGLCLAFDDNPPTSGSVTTAVAMGSSLINRLRSAGIAFELL